ncbi:M23 family metallopeptidase [Siccirubricoccus sp. KC 17139]|uniref:M23 family metallopeptidase n=1 Tax=Siccirubricoccus soli TaxID=2899147 RepID=A0ABT1DA31_9PROT|nr:M23 family metallopeptidase [Siccirubricoccus soli]MCP2684864.1 M23 family metallopeptidase [Siccirubricoccus soli]
MIRRALLALPALALARPAAAALSLPAAALAQGGFVTGRVPPGTALALEGKPLRIGPRGEFVFGFGRDHGPHAMLSVTPPGGRPARQRLAVARRPWNIQRLQGLPGAMVTPPPETMERIVRERETLAALRRTDSATPWFAAGFRWPAQGRISGVYGSQRILNGEPRAPHLGLDIAVPAGTVLHAAAAGEVLLAEELYFTGLTTILDHGHGVQTLYAHMSRLDLAPGQRVAAGEPVGLSGATGRVTGPHLHFGLTWFATWLDPQRVLPAG